MYKRQVFAVVLGLALATGCATYKQDLERAQGHYDANRYENALALFRVLEADIDSLEPAAVSYTHLDVYKRQPLLGDS